MFKLALTILALCSTLAFDMNLAFAADSDTVLARQLEKIFRERPELVLDVLRDHSEEILDIAQNGADLKRRKALEKQWYQDAKVEKSVATADRPIKGNANAKVRIVAFSDFTCNFCQKAANTLEQLQLAYGDKLSILFKHYPLATEASAQLASQYFAALALQNQELAWKFYSTIFQNRENLLTKGETYLKEVVDSYPNLDKARFNRDRTGKRVKEIINEDMEDAQKLKFDGTPCFLVNNLVVRGALPLDLFKIAVDIALDQANGKTNGKSEDNKI